MAHKRVIDYIPESKRAGVYDAWEDSDGIWIMLNEGWVADRSCAERTIHEDTVKDLRYQIAGIRKMKKGEVTEYGTWNGEEFENRCI